MLVCRTLGLTEVEVEVEAEEACEDWPWLLTWADPTFCGGGFPCCRTTCACWPLFGGELAPGACSAEAASRPA